MTATVLKPPDVARTLGAPLRDHEPSPTTFLAAGLALALSGHGHNLCEAPYGIIVLLAVAMGLQNATARHLAVPDLTTTVLTLTLTGVAADARFTSGGDSRFRRRILPVLTMFLGALAGGELVISGHATIALAAAIALSGLVGLAAAASSRMSGGKRGAGT